ncbi:MAG: RHS repeat-associated core domain-containing protein [Bacteroidia bacterium]|nr:RHS repeat-associated core domain-containing protein [Bacteroidia bacterium]
MKTEKYTDSQSGSIITYAYQAGTAIQDTKYYYDLNGNIYQTKEDTNTAGASGSGSLIRNFSYDPLYRLLSATGREAGGFSSADPAFVAPNDTSLGNTDTYTRNYEYDALGNILRLQHIPNVGSTWNRYFNDYDTAPSSAYTSDNLASKVKYAGTVYNYTYDANGNLIQEGSNRLYEWDHADQLRAFYNQAGTSEPSVYAQYLYDAGGNRVKKIVRKSSANTQVTVYLDGVIDYLYEIDGSNTVTEEFNDIHVMDDRKRIAVLSVYKSNYTGSTSLPIRFNLEDHLGNSSWTLDDVGAKISQEEYYPFGESSFHDFSYKRYRFVGKERDEESGLYYYGMRYYAPWMCRFISVDPLFRDYPWYTPYQYAGNKPIIAIDLDGLEDEIVVESASAKKPVQNVASTSAKTARIMADVNNLSTPSSHRKWVEALKETIVETRSEVTGVDQVRAYKFQQKIEEKIAVKQWKFGLGNCAASCKIMLLIGEEVIPDGGNPIDQNNPGFIKKVTQKLFREDNMNDSQLTSRTQGDEKSQNWTRTKATRADYFDNQKLNKSFEIDNELLIDRIKVRKESFTFTDISDPDAIKKLKEGQFIIGFDIETKYQNDFPGNQYGDGHYMVYFYNPFDKGFYGINPISGMDYDIKKVEFGQITKGGFHCLIKK